MTFKKERYRCVTIASALLLTSITPVLYGQTYHLDKVIQLAQTNDPLIGAIRYTEQAVKARENAVGYLPDPVFSFNAANLPTDGFALDQEPFTQFRVGVTQQLPRGESLSLNRAKQSEIAGQQPLKQEERRAKVKALVSQVWLEGEKAARAYQQVKDNRVLFEQLIEIVKASYSTALDHTRQQDILAAQLQLTRLDDRLTLLDGQLNAAVAQLNEWIGFDFAPGSVPITRDDLLNAKISTNLLNMNGLDSVFTTSNRNQLVSLLAEHPSSRLVEQSVKVGLVDVALSEQNYKPKWGVSASYALRKDEPSGRSRADFFSVGVTLDVPLFSKAQQDSYLEEARYNVEATKTQKLALIQSMLTQVSSVYQQHQYLAQRENLYLSQILPKVAEQAQAAYLAYTNDDGSASDAIEAQIAQLEAQLSLIDIQTQKLNSQVQLAYLLTSHPHLQSKASH